MERIANTPSSAQNLTASFSVAYHYPVIFDSDVFSKSNLTLSRLLKKPNGIRNGLIWIDSGVLNAFPELNRRIEAYFRHHRCALNLVAPAQVVAGGEAAKQQGHIEAMYRFMLEQHIDRHCVIIAIGGGAVLDAVGYACATFHRGVQCLRMPSTVLAQNDAGVGVKNGFNAFNKKNLIGTFSPPMAVLSDRQFLDGLPARDKIAGLAEAVKVAVIRDGNFFNWIEQHADKLAGFDPHASQHAIAQCAKLHLGQITNAGDPFEHGNARPLDYGHWSAHKLESLTHYDIRHGEAVAIGMALDALYAVKTRLLDNDEAQRLIGLLRTLGLPIWHPALNQTDDNGNRAILAGLEEFREHLGGELCITLPTAMGRAREVHTIQLPLLLESIDALSRIAGTEAPVNG